MAYELWDTDSANLIGDFPTEEDALTAVRHTIRARGLDAVATLALAFEDEAGETHPVASGTILAKRAQDSSSARSRLAG